MSAVSSWEWNMVVSLKLVGNGGGGGAVGAVFLGRVYHRMSHSESSPVIQAELASGCNSGVAG